MNILNKSIIKSFTGLFTLLSIIFLFAACGNKATYQVGDIVLEDGSVISSSQFETYSGTAKPMAVIYSTTGGHYENSSRVLGVGLAVSPALVFTPAESKGFITNILANQSVVAAQEFDISEDQYLNEGFFGLLDGRKSWDHVSYYDKNAEKSFKDYPAFDYAVNYGKNHKFKKFSKGWYLPTASEAYELAENIEIVNEALKKCGAPVMTAIVWTSSQEYGAQETEYVVDLNDSGVDIGFKDMEYNVCSIYCFAD